MLVVTWRAPRGCVSGPKVVWLIEFAGPKKGAVRAWAPLPDSAEDPGLVR